MGKAKIIAIEVATIFILNAICQKIIGDIVFGCVSLLIGLCFIFIKNYNFIIHGNTKR